MGIYMSRKRTNVTIIRSAPAGMVSREIAHTYVIIIYFIFLFCQKGINCLLHFVITKNWR